MKTCQSLLSRFENHSVAISLMNKASQSELQREWRATLCVYFHMPFIYSKRGEPGEKMYAKKWAFH